MFKAANICAGTFIKARRTFNSDSRQSIRINAGTVMQIQNIGPGGNYFTVSNENWSSSEIINKINFKNIKIIRNSHQVVGNRPRVSNIYKKLTAVICMLLRHIYQNGILRKENVFLFPPKQTTKIPKKEEELFSFFKIFTAEFSQFFDDKKNIFFVTKKWLNSAVKISKNEKSGPPFFSIWG